MMNMAVEMGQLMFGIFVGAGLIFLLMMFVFTLIYEHDKKIHHQFEEDSFHLAQIEPIIDKILEDDFVVQKSTQNGLITVAELHTKELQKNIAELRGYITEEMNRQVR